MGTETQHDIELATYQIDKIQAADLRARLACFAVEWERPEMRIYDSYEQFYRQVAESLQIDTLNKC